MSDADERAKLMAEANAQMREDEFQKLKNMGQHMLDMTADLRRHCDARIDGLHELAVDFMSKIEELQKGLLK